jgi:hypothetical protein
MKNVIVGYVECDKCNEYVTIEDPKALTIWYHPDDPRPLSEVNCPKCGKLISDRIDHEHMANFRRRGCHLKSLSEKFSALTEEDIDNWIFDADFKNSFGKQRIT